VTRSPIHKALSTFRRRKVRALLLGGQACTLDGGAEFTRDVDIAVAVDPANLKQLRWLSTICRPSRSTSLPMIRRFL
jgi:hypothetical protein